MSYLLDTNVVINFLDDSLPSAGMNFIKYVVDTASYISVITKIESLGFHFESHREQATMEAFIHGSTVLEIDSNTAEECIRIRKSTKIALADAIIGATAIVHDLILLTRNTKDFKNISNLQLQSPWDVN